jgi:hypothetical protein
MKRLRNLSLPLLLILLAGCGILGVPQPQTLRERIAAAYVTEAAVRQTGLTLLQARKITPADNANVNQTADNARAGIEIARSLESVDPANANTRLQLSIEILTGLQQYLEGRK